MPGAHSWTLFLFFSLFILFAPFATCLSINRTIDDTNGDEVTGSIPVYNPPSAWDTQTCTGCLVIPDIVRAEEHTWHAATASPQVPTNVDFQFTGTAIYIFFIVPNADTGIASNFLLDGLLAGNIVQAPSTLSDDIYNALVFSQTGLTNTTHTFSIVSDSTTQNVLTIFDYAIYTQEEQDVVQSTATPTLPVPTTQATAQVTTKPTASADNTTTRSVPVGGITAAVLGSLAIIILIVSTTIFCRRRHRSRQARPFDMESKAYLDPAPTSNSRIPIVTMAPVSMPYYGARTGPLPAAIASSQLMHTAAPTSNSRTFQPKNVVSADSASLLSTVALSPPPRSFYTGQAAESPRPTLRVQTSLPSSGSRPTQEKKRQSPKPPVLVPAVPPRSSTSTSSSRTMATRVEVARMQKEVEAMREYIGTLAVDSDKKKNNTRPLPLPKIPARSDLPPEYFSPVASVRPPVPTLTVPAAAPGPLRRQVTNW